MMTNASLPEDDLGGQGEAETRRGGWGWLFTSRSHLVFICMPIFQLKSQECESEAAPCRNELRDRFQVKMEHQVPRTVQLPDIRYCSPTGCRQPVMSRAVPPGAQQSEPFCVFLMLPADLTFDLISHCPEEFPLVFLIVLLLGVHSVKFCQPLFI